MWKLQAWLATTDRCINVMYFLTLFVLLFMYAILHFLYSVWNNNTTTTNIYATNDISLGEWNFKSHEHSLVSKLNEYWRITQI